MIRDAIATLLESNDLDRLAASEAMATIMDGEATPAQIGAFLVALRLKGETVDEIAGCASAMRERVVPVRAVGPLLDTCGTGGDGSGTFNISTTVAFVAAGAGVRVAKHGNRSISSACGSADVLEALGARLDLGADRIARCIDEVGIGFLFAPGHHPAMKHAMGPRRELGIRTIFNVLGPLTNPAGADSQLLGVFAADLVTPIAHVLSELGSRSAVVVNGAGGLDEVSPAGETRAAVLRDGCVEEFVWTPGDFGVPGADLAALAGGDAEENARILRGVLEGETGPRRDVTLMNGACALLAAGTVSDLGAGMERATESVDSGTALAVLDQFVEFTRSEP